MLAGRPEDNEPGQDVVSRVGHVQSGVAVLDRLGYPVQDVRWTVRGQ